MASQSQTRKKHCPPPRSRKPARESPKEEISQQAKDMFKRVAQVKSSGYTRCKEVRSGPTLSKNRRARINCQVPSKGLPMATSALNEIQTNRSQSPFVSVTHVQNVLGMCKRIRSQSSITERKKNPYDLELYPVPVRSRGSIDHDDHQASQQNIISTHEDDKNNWEDENNWLSAEPDFSYFNSSLNKFSPPNCHKSSIAITHWRPRETHSLSPVYKKLIDAERSRLNGSNSDKKINHKSKVCPFEIHPWYSFNEPLWEEQLAENCRSPQQTSHAAVAVDCIKLRNGRSYYSADDLDLHLQTYYSEIRPLPYDLNVKRPHSNCSFRQACSDSVGLSSTDGHNRINSAQSSSKFQSALKTEGDSDFICNCSSEGEQYSEDKRLQNSSNMPPRESALRLANRDHTENLCRGENPYLKWHVLDYSFGRSSSSFPTLSNKGCIDDHRNHNTKASECYEARSKFTTKDLKVKFREKAAVVNDDEEMEKSFKRCLDLAYGTANPPNGHISESLASYFTKLDI